MQSKSAERTPNLRAGADFGLNLGRSEEHTSELQSRLHLVCRLLLEKKKNNHLSTVTNCRSDAHIAEMTHPWHPEPHAGETPPAYQPPSHLSRLSPTAHSSLQLDHLS